MSIKKLPSTLNNEELLKLLKETPEVKTDDTSEIVEKVNNHDVFIFLGTFNIIPGNQGIKRHTLYSIYKAWSKERLDRKEFFVIISKFFRSNEHGYCFINQNAIKLAHDVYLKFKRINKRLKHQAWAKNYQNFLDYYAIKEGNFWIEEDLFYFVYDKYYNEKKLPQYYESKFIFIEYCKLHFERKVTNKGPVYGVSENIQNLFQPGQLERMRNERAKEQEKKEQKEKPKKRRKVSRTRSKVQPKNKGRSNRSRLSS